MIPAYRSQPRPDSGPFTLVSELKASRSLFIAKSYYRKALANAEALLALGSEAEPGAFEASYADVMYWEAQVIHFQDHLSQ